MNLHLIIYLCEGKTKVRWIFVNILCFFYICRVDIHQSKTDLYFGNLFHLVSSYFLKKHL